MRFKLIVAILISLAARDAVAQQLTIVTADGRPAANISVEFRGVSNGKSVANASTNSHGEVSLPALEYPCVLVIDDLLMGSIADTLRSAATRTLVLHAALHTIPAYVITGQYATNTRDNAVQKIEVIDRKKIDAMAAQTLRDVLTNQAEIRIANDPIFGASANMQGSKTYGADAKILIDGIPVVGKQNGAVDLSQINLANVERIEIVTGPMSVTYGTDAIAGTINIITRKTVKKTLEVAANTYYESIVTYNVNMHVGFHKRRHRLVLDAARNFFGGWNPGDGISLFDFKATLADSHRTQLWKPREQYMGTAQYVVSLGKLTATVRSSYFNELITNRGTPLAPYLETAFDDKYHTRRFDNAVFLSGGLGENKNLQLMAAWNAYRRIKNTYANDLTALSTVATPDGQDTSKYNEFNSRGQLAVSRGGAKVSYEVGYDINLQYANSTQIDGHTKEMGNYALFASMEYKPFKKLTIRPGVRQNFNTQYNAPLVPSVNLMYKEGKNWTFRASYAKGFRQPGLKELYFDFVDINHNIHGNTQLKAELSDNYTFSIVYNGKYEEVTYRLNMTSYYNDVNNLISLAAVANGAANEYTYVNIGNYKTRGGTLSAELGKGAVSGTIGGSLISTYNQESEQYTVDRYSYSPEVFGSITYTFPEYDLSLSAFYKYTGRFIAYGVDNGGVYQSVMNGYHTADVTACKKLWGKRMEIAAGCKNLFDVNNVLATRQTSGAHSVAANSAAIGTGRLYFMKLSINLSVL